MCNLEELIQSVDVIVIKAYTKIFNRKGTTKFKQAWNSMQQHEIDATCSNVLLLMESYYIRR
jgi:hypothetical protein